ncbi:MAG: MOSC domain-containing protein [Synechococcales bacterium]|nr:MOSC domain-containing protein [Synechococcales bacterium]
MPQEKVGTVAALWRYPVKSMLGEPLETSEVTTHGLLGDRAYALWDVERRRVASAKNPRRWKTLLDFQANYLAPPSPQATIPPVQVTLPDGAVVTSDTPDVDAIFSDALGREVQMISSPPEAVSLDQYWPDVEGTAHQDAITQLFLPEGTFFDSCPIHAITTATLAKLQELYPEGEFAASRFRPNLVIEPLAEARGFVEDDWVTGILQIGEQVRLQVDTPCPRCVVTTLAQAGLPEDLNILRTTARHHQVIAGIRASVIHGGTIRQNDLIWLEHG